MVKNSLFNDLNWLLSKFERVVINQSIWIGHKLLRSGKNGIREGTDGESTGKKHWTATIVRLSTGLKLPVVHKRLQWLRTNGSKTIGATRTNPLALVHKVASLERFY